MPTGYQIKDQSAPHYLTFQLVYWIDLFSRQLQDLYALYKVSDTSYKSMGKITLLTYELKTLDMVIVPLEGVSYNFGDVQTELNKIYGPLGIEWRVKTDSVFRSMEWDLIKNDILDAEESQSFSMYSPEMRALNRLYKEQRGVDSKTMYMFVVKEINGKRGGLLGDMPLSSQFGYLAASNDVKLAAKTIAHELGHGMFYLRHTFSQYNLAEDSTDNLMDYKPEGTQLFKKQWDEIFDPRRPWFAWRQDEEEGASVIDRPGRIRAITELVRYAYACGKSIILEHGTPSTNNITLGDNHKYGYIGIYIKEDVTISNLKSSFQNYIPPRTWDGSEKRRIGFGNSSIEFITFTNDIGKLEEYITSSQDKETYLNSIDKLISGWENHYYSLNALPSSALSDLSNTQRINLMNKIANSEIRDVDALAARVMANVPNESATDFFEKLKQTTLFYTFRKKMSNDNYTEFIKSATLLYYRQDLLKEKLLNISPNKMFAHLYREGPIGASITNEFSVTETEILITGNVVVVIRSTGSESPFEAYNQQPNQTTSFQAYSNPVNYFDLVGIELHSDLGNIWANGKVVPMPAFYFEWLYTNQKRQNMINAIDASVTILSLAVGIGELRVVAAAGRAIFITKTSLGILKSAVNLGLLNERIHSSLVNQPWGEDFLIGWKTFCWVYDIASFDLRTVNMNRNFFNDFLLSWNISKEIIQQNVEFDLYEEINTLMTEIEENK